MLANERFTEVSKTIESTESIAFTSKDASTLIKAKMTSMKIAGK